MPDHGVRVPPYLSGNLAIGILGVAPYGWTGTPSYRAELLPANDYFPADQFAYERIDYDAFKQQQKDLLHLTVPAGHFSNPNFLGASQMLGSDGRVPEWMRREGGGVARILRGFIRRWEIDPSDQRSFVRLMFMWNPDELRRQYQSVADNPVLDVTGALNVASGDEPIPPAMVEIQFTLYFDRQAEVATIADHPGVLVDLQAFDILAGNASATGTQQYSGDKGTAGTTGTGDVAGTDPGVAAVAMAPDVAGGSIALAPTRVTAVFAPNLAFYGTLTGAEATFTKFSSRMVPTAMTLTINMTLLSIGTSWAKQDLVQTPTATSGMGQPTTNPELFDPTNPAFKQPTTIVEIDAANKSGGPQAINWGLQWVGTPYERDYRHRMDGPPLNNKAFRSDCSSFVWRCYRAVGWTGTLGLTDGNAPNTDGFIAAITGHPNKWEFVKLQGVSTETKKQIVRNLYLGDIFVRGWKGNTPGHIVMFAGLNDTSGVPSYDGKNCLKLHSTPEQVKYEPVTGKSFTDNFEYWARPIPFGRR